MNRSSGRASGVRLPVFLLLGFIALLAGGIIWLATADPEPDAQSATAKPGPGKSAPPPVAEKPEAAAPAAPSSAAETPPADERPGIESEPAVVGPAAPPTDPAPRSPPQDAKVTPPSPESETAESAPADKTSPSEEEKIPAGAPPAEPKAPAGRSVAGQDTVPPPSPDMPIIASLPPVTADPALPPSPDPGLIEPSGQGPVPRVGDDGRLPWRVYAKPFDSNDRRPRMAIVITGLGLSAAATTSAIQGLPGGVTLAFSPYAKGLDEWIRLARTAGHEILISVPMEPEDYPAYDPGAKTLLLSLDERENLERLMWSLSRATGYVGVIDFFGTRFTTSRQHLTPVLAALKGRGLLYLDGAGSSRSVAGAVARGLALPWAESTRILDDRASRTEIDRRFAELEKIAKETGRAIGVGFAYPVTLERVANWARQLDARGVAIAPVSALVSTGAQDR